MSYTPAIRSFVSVSHDADTVGIGLNSDIVFTDAVAGGGGLGYNGITGVFGPLRRSTTYVLSANLMFASFTSAGTGTITVQWVNAANNAAVVFMGGISNYSSLTTIADDSYGPDGTLVFSTPSGSDLSIKLRCIAATGTATLLGAGTNKSSAIVTMIPS